MTVAFHVREPAGGLGDRIVGLVSAIFLARATGRELRITWDWPDITHCVDYEHFELPEQFAKMNARDKEDRFKGLWAKADINKVMGDPEVFTLTCNQNLGQYLWQNPHYKHLFGDYLAEQLAAYRAVFRSYLRPRMTVRSHEVGIQVRIGDAAMGHSEHIAQTGEQAFRMLEAAKPYCEGKSVFLTSDSDLVVDAARDVLGEFGYCQGEIRHIDKDPTEAGTHKAFYDMLTLSRCDTLIYTDASNFGRVPALMNRGRLLAWDGDRLLGTNLRALTSKDEVVA